VSLSFNAVPSGSGQTRQMVLTLTNIGGTARTLDLAVIGAPSGVGYTVGPSTVGLAAGASVEVTVTMTAERGASTGFKQALLVITEGATEIAHAALFTLIK
jgi:hypothetical protein